MRMRRWGILAMMASLLCAGAALAALPPDRALAGVRVGSKGNIVLHRYGNPSVVVPGLGESAVNGGGTISSAGPANPCVAFSP